MSNSICIFEYIDWIMQMLCAYGGNDGRNIKRKTHYLSCIHIVWFKTHCIKVYSSTLCRNHLKFFWVSLLTNSQRTLLWTFLVSGSSASTTDLRCCVSFSSLFGGHLRFFFLTPHNPQYYIVRLFLNQIHLRDISRNVHMMCVVRRRVGGKWVGVEFSFGGELGKQRFWVTFL